ncbi:MAG TPA: prolyl oligopeptidase family serine peptidase [Bryobacteraceae bacterium]|nr:prolyl oligopeptidase family serine peptidase [Bryobacteraceae bacterium]
MRSALAAGPLALFSVALMAWGQQVSGGVRTGPQQAFFHSNIDDSQQPYALYVPKSFDSSKKYPLVISLHQEESNHRLNLKAIFGVITRLGGETDTEDMRYFPPVRDVDFLVACPYARGTMGYRGIAEKDVYDILEDVKSRFPIDNDRVYLTGISMGGAGALWLAFTRPDLWAAVAPVCPQPMEGLEELAPNAIQLPVRLFHGDQDPIVPVEGSRVWQRRLQDAGVQADYLEFPGVRHNAWDMAYRNGAIFDWFAKYHRDRDPGRVRFVTRSYRYNSAYWVRIDGLTPGLLASIDASWHGTELGIQTRNVDGFTVRVGPGRSAPRVVTIDGVAVRVKPGAPLAFTRVEGNWRAGAYPPTAKHPGAEGPISEAVSGRQIYVYGAGGAHTAEELAARRQVAESAAAWSTARSHLSLSLPVKSDGEVTAADIDSADLILFGTSETNSLIARFARSLPLSLSSAAPDYGLLFIAHDGKHYILVNSGLPWWTGAEETDRSAKSPAPEQFRLLSSFGDYILFKGSLKNVVAEGRFDRNWKVPAEAAARLSALAPVTVH